MYYGQQQMNNYYYVNGLEGAKQYQMMPNQTILLMDSENPMFYLKTTNQIGQSTLRAFKFEEIDLKKENDKYATIESVNALSLKIDDLIKTMKGEAKDESNI